MTTDYMMIIHMMTDYMMIIHMMNVGVQLADNSRQWGRERAELQIRMSETDNGFGRSGGLVLHDYPLLVGSMSHHFLYFKSIG